MRRSEKAVSNFSRTAGIASIGIGRIAAPLLAVGVAAISTRRLIGGLGAEFKRLEAIGKTSDKLGIATEALMGLQFAAEQTGVGTKVLDTALQRMVRRSSEAGAGIGATGKALEEMEINVKAFSQLSPDKQFSRMADAMAGVATQGDRVRLTISLFDTEGAALVNTLALGSKGLDDMQKQLGKLGGLASRKDIFGIERADEALNRFAIARRGLFTQVAISAAPAVEMLANNFSTLATDAMKHLRTAIDLTELFAKSAAFVVDVWEALVITVKGLSIAMLASLGTASVGISLLSRAANQLPGVDIDTTNTDNFTRNIRGAIEDLKTEISISFNAPSNVSKVEEVFAKAKAAFEEFQAAAARGGGAIVLSDADKAATNFVATLTLQNQAIGKTANQFVIMRLEAARADASLITLAKNLNQIGIRKNRVLEFNDTLAAMREKIFDLVLDRSEADKLVAGFRGDVSPQRFQTLQTASKQLESLQRTAEQTDIAKNLFDATRTPMEQFQARMEKLVELRDKMFISEDLFKRGALNAVAELGITALAPSPKALERGTAAAFSASNQSKRKSGVENLLKQQLDQMKEDAVTQDTISSRLDKLTSRLASEGFNNP